MKGSQSSKKKKNKFSKRHFFDTVIILALLNVALLAVVVFYEKNLSVGTGQKNLSLLTVDTVPLPKDIESINASAAAYVVFDSKSRSVIASKNKDLRFSPASTAKVMSALVVLDHYNLEDYLMVPWNIYEVPGSRMHLVPGEEVKVIDLLYGMMLPSGNDAAYTFAYHYPGGYDAFVKRMNEKAMEYKLFNTKFKDPAGYDDGNFTTAEELARLGILAIENEVLAQIVKTRYYETTNKANNHTFYLQNLNELLVYDNVLGIKTGFTNEAGGVLLTAIQKGDSIFIVCVLKSNDRFYDTRDLMEFIVEKVDFALPPSDPLSM